MYDRQHYWVKCDAEIFVITEGNRVQTALYNQKLSSLNINCVTGYPHISSWVLSAPDSHKPILKLCVDWLYILSAPDSHKPILKLCVDWLHILSAPDSHKPILKLCVDWLHILSFTVSFSFI